MEEHQSDVNKSSLTSDHKKAKLTSNNDCNVNDHRNKNKQTDATNSRKKESGKRTRNRQNDNPDVQLSKSLSWLLRHTAPSLGLHPTSDGYISVDEILSLDHPRFRRGKDAKYTVQDVRRVVENNDKQRFRLEYISLSAGDTASTDLHKRDFNDESSKTNDADLKDNLTLCIRANQGHSYKNIIQCDKLLTPLTADELSDPNLTIIHGTTRKAWEDHIRIEGLNRMKRNHIHFATGLPATKDTMQYSCSNLVPISGIRSTSQVYIYVNGGKCAVDGIQFFRSDNGVILTAGEKDEGLLPAKYFQKVVLASSGKILYEED
jgi:2'-phosphotransferase